MKYFPSLMRLISGIVLILIASGDTYCQSKKLTKMDCTTWISKIDQSYGDTGILLTSIPTDQEVVEAISCLLHLKGDKRPARFSGVTSTNVSQMLPKATIELAALYYISYLYDGQWQHADGVALWNRKGEINLPGSIEKAYGAYEEWFSIVKTIGINTAKNRHMDPLKGTNLYWYGN